MYFLLNRGFSALFAASLCINQQKRDLPKKQILHLICTISLRFGLLYRSIHKCVRCVVFFHTYTRAKSALLLFSTETCSARSGGWLYGCSPFSVGDCERRQRLMLLLLCQYVILSVFLAHAMRLPCGCVCVFVSMRACVCVYVCVFSVPF